MNLKNRISSMAYIAYLLFSFFVFLGFAKACEALGVFNPIFVESGGIWKAALFLWAIWAVLSTISLVEHIWGIDAGNYIVASAITASPFATAAFCFFWPLRHESWSFIGAACFLAAVSTTFGLASALVTITFGQALEKLALGRLFRLMGF